MKIFYNLKWSLWIRKEQKKRINFVSQELQAKQKNKYFRKIPPSKRKYAVEVSA